MLKIAMPISRLLWLWHLWSTFDFWQSSHQHVSTACFWWLVSFSPHVLKVDLPPKKRKWNQNLLFGKGNLGTVTYPSQHKLESMIFPTSRERWGPSDHLCQVNCPTGESSNWTPIMCRSNSFASTWLNKNKVRILLVFWVPPQKKQVKMIEAYIRKWRRKTRIRTW